ncbi:MAG: YeeE/YedE family protein [Desulfuromonadales bacterium]|nr:YeeE/YedE family protein [Desulfuromonadales bacterium]
MPDSGIILTIALLFFCGFVSGYLMHRSDFCMAGAFRDLFLFRSGMMLKALLILVAAAAVLFELEYLAGWVTLPFPIFKAPTLFGLMGGVLFGFGMVLSGGCVVGVLYKSGSGSRPALTALLGLIVGSGLYAEVHQIITPWLRRTELTTHVTLSQLTGISSFWWVLTLALGVLFLARRWWRTDRMEERTFSAQGYIQPWKTALLLALLVALGAASSGVPFGVTTSYLKFAATVEKLLLPQHFSTLSLFNTQPLVYLLPLSQERLTGGAGPAWDAFAVLQYPLIAGIILGAVWSSAWLKEWSWRGHFPLSQVVTVFSGGIIMAFGSRIADGCNIWHIWGGVPIFAIQSLLFVFGLFPGAWLGSLVIKQVILGREGA